MKIGDFLYFAPGIRFQDLKLDTPELVQQFKARIEGYYLVPAGILTEKGHAFGAVALLASALDALGRFDFPDVNGNTERYINWAELCVPSLGTTALATQFYKEIRCGILHEARAKYGCVFTTETGFPIVVEDGLMAVNPEKFGPEVAQVLDAFCARVLGSAKSLADFQKQLKSDFATELPTAVKPTIRQAF